METGLVVVQWVIPVGSVVPIVRFRVADAEAAAANLQEAGIACAVRAGSVRVSFHLYNDENDVEIAASAVGAVE